jgi:hypothetical protein
MSGPCLVLRFGRQPSPPCPECHRRALRHALFPERGHRNTFALVLRCGGCHFDAIVDELQVTPEPDLNAEAARHEGFEEGFDAGIRFAEARCSDEIDEAAQ